MHLVRVVTNKMADVVVHIYLRLVYIFCVDSPGPQSAYNALTLVFQLLFFNLRCVDFAWKC